MLAALVAAAWTAFGTASARATDILVTNFDAYAIGNLSGQVGFAGPAGTWATSGATNSPFVTASVIGPGTAPGVDPVGGTGRMVRLVTERFTLGRSKAWLDLLNSGQWAAASAGGNSVLETRVKLFVPGQQRVTSTFGIMISRSSSETSGGFLVSAQTGAISLLNGGYAAANRVATGVAATLDQWNEFVYRWNAANGEGSLSMNGAIVATHVTSGFGGVYASNLLSTSDSTPGSATGRLPTASTIRGASSTVFVPSSAVTSTRPGPASRPVPRCRVTLFLPSSASMPFASVETTSAFRFIIAARSNDTPITFTPCVASSCRAISSL